MPKLTALIVFVLPVFMAGVMPMQVRAEDDFGRLFSSPAERKKLDMLRKSQQLIATTPQQNISSQLSDVELPEPITMQGYVKRSDGATTLWINNKTVHENSTQDQVEIGRLNKPKHSSHDAADSLTVRIPATGKNVRLKAGQQYDPENDRIVELKLLEKEKQLRMQETGFIGGSDAE